MSYPLVRFGREALGVLILFGWAFSFAPPSAPAATTAEEAESAEKLVAEALHREIYGQEEAREGDDAYAFFLVLAGELDVHVDFNRIATLKPGDFFGEVGLELDTKRSAHVAARGKVKLAKMMIWDYKQMVQELPLVHDRIAA